MVLSRRRSSIERRYSAIRTAGVHESAHVVRQHLLLFLVVDVPRIEYRELEIALVAAYLVASAHSLGASLAGECSCVDEREVESAAGACQCLAHSSCLVVRESVIVHRLVECTHLIISDNSHINLRFHKGLGVYRRLMWPRPEAGLMVYQNAPYLWVPSMTPWTTSHLVSRSGGTSHPDAMHTCELSPALHIAVLTS